MAKFSQYRIPIARLKDDYNRRLARDRIRRRLRERKTEPHRADIQDNSEPWLPNGPKSFSDCITISDRIQESIEQWKQPQVQ